MDIEERHQTGKKIPSSASRTMYRRRIGILRMLVMAVMMAVALGLFIFWYRSWPQRMSCNQQAYRLAAELDNYRDHSGRLPTVLEMLPEITGRYSIDHYAYYFIGLGGPTNLPEGTILAYCRNPHRGLFTQPGRHVLVKYQGQIIVIWMTEEEFEPLLHRQRIPEHF